MRLLKALYRQSPRWTVVALAGATVSGVAGALSIMVVNQAVSRPDFRGAVAAGAFLGCLALDLLFRMLSERAAAQAVYRLGRELRGALVERVLQSPVSLLEAHGPAKLLSVLTVDVSTFLGTAHGMPYVAKNLMLALGGLGYMTWLSPQFAVWTLGMLALGVLGFRALAGIETRGAHRLRAAQGSVIEAFQELFDGIRELKLHRPRREAFLERELLASSLELRATALRERRRLVFTTASSLTSVMVFIAAILFVPPEAMPMQHAELVSFVFATLFLLGPVEVATAQVRSIREAEAAFDRLSEMGWSLEAQPVAVGEDGPGEPFRTVALSGVCWRYPGADPDSEGFGPVDLELRAGELAFVVGGNGSGKTTLAKLLCGLYPPTSGEWRVNGRAVSEEEWEHVQGYFSAVFSDAHLFSELFGIGGEERAHEARGMLDWLGLGQRVRLEGRRFSSLQLSSGQRKRLALLVARLEKRPVLILDEWAAEQDPEFRDAFYREILPVLRSEGRAILVISHDDRYFSLADRIVRMEQGRILEDSAVAA